MPLTIHIHPADNVVVALRPLARGTAVELPDCGQTVTAAEDIPQGHKMAVSPIRAGENVVKYGFPIGHATADIAPGGWVHTHNLKTNLSGEVEYTYAPDLHPLAPVTPESFMGFRRADGRAAIRNELWIIPTVGCVNDVAKALARTIRILSPAASKGCTPFRTLTAAPRPGPTTPRPASCSRRWPATRTPAAYWCFRSAAKT